MSPLRLGIIIILNLAFSLKTAKCLKLALKRPEIWCETNKYIEKIKKYIGGKKINKENLNFKLYVDLWSKRKLGYSLNWLCYVIT